MNKVILYILFFSGVYTQAYGQFLDSLAYEVRSLTAIAPSGNVPLYLVSNRFGLLEDTTFNQLLGVGISRPFQAEETVSIAFQASVFGRYATGGTDFFLQQGYLGLRYKALSLYAGRREQTWGVHYPDLSMGSLAVSQNSRPLPMIQVAIDSFINVPFTRGYVTFKGNFGHAWLEKERYIERPYLHLKSLYLKSQVNLPVNLYFGITHFALWGGQHPKGDTIPQGFDDYLRVIAGMSSSGSRLKNERLNALGNHLGIAEYGLLVKAKHFDLTVYNQMPYEDKSGLRRSIFNRDRLLGIDLRMNKLRYPVHFLYEYMHTLHQSGPGITDPPDGYSRKDLTPNYGYLYGGRDDYYNNSLYRSGWSYQGRIIGNPLFMTERYASRFLNHVNSFFQDIVNNRIRAHHVGVKIATQHLSFRLLGTYSRNYGTYAGLNGGQEAWLSKQPEFSAYQYAFKQPLRQYYGMLESTAQLPDTGLQFTLSVGYDTGQIYRSGGVMAGLRWTHNGRQAQ